MFVADVRFPRAIRGPPRRMRSCGAQQDSLSPPKSPSTDTINNGKITFLFNRAINKKRMDKKLEKYEEEIVEKKKKKVTPAFLFYHKKAGEDNFKTIILFIS